MKKIILISVVFLMVASLGFALTVRGKTGFGYGLVVGGNTAFPPSISAPITGDWILDTNFWSNTGVWKNTSTWNN